MLLTLLRGIDQKLELVRMQVEQQGSVLAALQQTCAARLRVCHGDMETPVPVRKVNR